MPVHAKLLSSLVALVLAPVALTAAQGGEITTVGQPILLDSAPGHPPRDLALADDGRFVFVWEPSSVAPQELRARIHAADGTAETPSFVVSSGIRIDATRPSVAYTSAEQFVVAWVAVGPEAIFARRFGADGNALDDEFEVAGPFTPLGRDVRVTGTGDGGFLVAHTIPHLAALFFTSLKAQRYDPTGVPVGPAQLIDRNERPFEGIPTRPQLALGDGRILAGWSSFDFNDDLTETRHARLRALDLTGAPAAPPLNLSPFPGELDGIAALADGRFVATWFDESANSGDTVLADILDADGQPIANSINLGSENSRATVAANAVGFVVAWHDHTTVTIQGYGLDGMAATEATQVVHDDDIRAHQLFMNPAGRMLVSWITRPNDPAPRTVKARFAQFTMDGLLLFRDGFESGDATAWDDPSD